MRAIEPLPKYRVSRKRFTRDVFIALVTIIAMTVVLQMLLHAFYVYKPIWVPFAAVVLAQALIVLTDR